MGEDRPLGPTSPTPLPPVEVASRSSRPGRAPRLPDRCCADCRAPQPLQPQGYAPTAAPLFSRLFLQLGEPPPPAPELGPGLWWAAQLLLRLRQGQL